MRIAIISDVHSNLEALQAALETIDARGVDALYCLGDTVGYGADPAPCVELVRARCAGVVRGNHDEAVATGRDVNLLPRDGRTAAQHNHERLSEEQRAWLAGLPLVLGIDDCTFVHATADQPAAWRRVDSYKVVREQFEHFTTPVCFAGHSHLPAVVAEEVGILTVRRGVRFFINVGSVGQPRDGNRRACVAFFDTDAFTYELTRVSYPVEAAAQRIRDENLPEGLARRLLMGR